MGSGKSPKKRCNSVLHWPDLVIEGPDSSPADVITELLNVSELLVYRFAAPQGRILRLEQHIVPVQQCRSVKGPTSGGRHPAKMLPGSEEIFEPLVVTHDPVNNPPTAAHDLNR